MKRIILSTLVLFTTLATNAHNRGLTKIIDQSTSKNSVFQLTLGYKFGL